MHIVYAVILLSLSLCSSRLQCPDGWYLSHGVKPSGEFRCTDAQRGLRCGEDGVPPCPDPGPAAHGRIYCTSGMQPIVVDYRTVGCQRGGR